MQCSRVSAACDIPNGYAQLAIHWPILTLQACYILDLIFQDLSHETSRTGAHLAFHEATVMQVSKLEGLD